VCDLSRRFPITRVLDLSRDMQMQPLVSLVTPVYNGEKYLAECIESVLVQTYQNWEYIIVNNCSTDRSLEIVEGYAKTDPRFRIHNNQKFVGMIQNHNIAFRQISSESHYCKMVHADDWLFPECIMQMVKVAEAHPTVGIVGAYGLYGTRICWDGLPYPSTVISGREICRRSLLDSYLGDAPLYVFGSPTSLLIRSQLIRDRQTFYNESNLHADKEACFDLLQSSDFGFVHQVLTYSRQHSEAATSFSTRFNTYLLGNLIILKKYGPVYLSREEYNQCLKYHMQRYYLFLGQSLLWTREKQLLDYHKNGMRALGHPYNWTKLLQVLVLEGLDILGNPKKTLERIARRIMRVVQSESMADKRTL
jgi:glycosyltransferase involved in cell wall biosynthesis